MYQPLNSNELKNEAQIGFFTKINILKIMISVLLVILVSVIIGLSLELSYQIGKCDNEIPTKINVCKMNFSKKLKNHSLNLLIQIFHFSLLLHGIFLLFIKGLLISTLMKALGNNKNLN